MATKNSIFSIIQVLLALAIIAASFKIMMSSIIEVREKRSEFRANLTYYATQVDYELQQIVDHINQYVQNDPSVDLESLIMRLDIVWSRLAHDTPSLRDDLYLSLPGATEFSKDALKTLGAIEPDLATLERDDYAQAISIQSELRRLVPLSHAVSMQAIAYDAQNEASHLDGMSARNRFIICLMLAFLGLAGFSLYQSWREVRASFVQSAQLERRVETRTAELKATNRKLRAEIEERGRAEERFRLLVEHAPDAITILDAQTVKFVEVNPRMEALLACPKKRWLPDTGLWT